MSTISDETSDTASAITAPSSFKFDYDAVVQVRYMNENGVEAEEPIYGHHLVLSSFSPLFRQLLIESSSSSDEELKTIDLNLCAFPNALKAFKIIMSAMYTGDVKLDSAKANEVLAICRYCQISGIESKVMAAAASAIISSNSQPFNGQANIASNFNLSNILNQDKPVPLPMPQMPPLQFQNYLSTMLQLWNNPLFTTLLTNSLMIPPASPNTDETTSRAQSDSRSSGSSPRTNSMGTPPNMDHDKIVPNDDREGWCRNKKYIEKVDGGFMCIVCRKIYGRYNSVSYHVTIYHRNPPIRCEENGCNFSTREARYIHFHKYYRHHIPLPENIDLGSRKCPFCRHVSKSPAMLEKHIARHDADGSQGLKKGLKDSSRNLKKSDTKSTTSSSNGPSSTTTTTTTSSTPTISENVKTNLPQIQSNLLSGSTPVYPPTSTPMKCTLCPFTTFATDVLFMHLASTHAEELAQLSNTSAEPTLSAATTTISVDDNADEDDMDEIDIKPNIMGLASMKPLQLDTSP